MILSYYGNSDTFQVEPCFLKHNIWIQLKHDWTTKASKVIVFHFTNTRVINAFHKIDRICKLSCKHQKKIISMVLVIWVMQVLCISKQPNASNFEAANRLIFFLYLGLNYLLGIWYEILPKEPFLYVAACFYKSARNLHLTYFINETLYNSDEQ